MSLLNQPRVLVCHGLGEVMYFPVAFRPRTSFGHISYQRWAYLSSYLAFDGCLQQWRGHGGPKIRIGTLVQTPDVAVWMAQNVGGNLYFHSHRQNRRARLEYTLGCTNSNTRFLSQLAKLESRKSDLYRFALSYRSGISGPEADSFYKEFIQLRDNCRVRPHPVQSWASLAGLVDSSVSIYYSNHNRRGVLLFLSAEGGTLTNIACFLEDQFPRSSVKLKPVQKSTGNWYLHIQRPLLQDVLLELLSTGLLLKRRVDVENLLLQ